MVTAPTPVARPRSRPRFGGDAGGDAGASAVAQADRLLAALAGLRRSGRRLAGRPVELSPLTGAQLELVKLLRRRSDVSVAEAAEELNLAANTVSTLVGQLVEAGLVRRRVDVADRRVARLDLTPHMRRKVDAWRDTRVVAVGEVLGRLSGRERRCVQDALPVLERLAAELEMTRPPRHARRGATT